MKYLLISAWFALIAIGPLKLNCSAQTHKADPQAEHRPSSQPPTAISNATPQKDENPTGKKAEEGQPKPVRITEMPPNDTWYKTYVIATLILVGVASFGVYKAHKTLKAIELQACTMRRQTKAAIIAARAARNNAEALVNSERAWVLVDIFKIPPFKPDPNQLQILWIFPTIKNYGKTVARIKRVAGIVKLIPEGEKLPVVPEYILGQGFDEQIDIVLPPEVPMQPRLGVSGDEWIKVQQGKFSLFVHGFIEYFDGVSEEQRRSAYCFSYVIQGGYSPAETGFYPYLAAPRAYTECT